VANIKAIIDMLWHIVTSYRAKGWRQHGYRHQFAGEPVKTSPNVQSDWLNRLQGPINVVYTYLYTWPIQFWFTFSTYCRLLRYGI